MRYTIPAGMSDDPLFLTAVVQQVDSKIAAIQHTLDLTNVAPQLGAHRRCSNVAT